MSAMIPCCEDMEDELALTCADHPDRHDCPDALLHRYEDGRTGILIHDGGSSMRTIHYCPWCGVKLPV